MILSEVCSRCGKEFEELSTYQGKKYCADCYRKQIDEEAGTSGYMAYGSYSSTSTSRNDYGETAINTLSIFAKISLFGGILGALIIWFSIGSSDFGLNPVGIVSGIIVLVEGLFCWALFQVICSIASNLIAIRKNTERK